MPARGTARIGTSGWVYPPWRGVFYPKGLRQKDELAFAASRMNSVEINGSFYSLQRPTSWERWRDDTPADFVFSAKGARFITHTKRLADVDKPLANFFAQGILALGPKLGCIIWQLPPTLRFDPVLIEEFLARLPRTSTAALALARQREDRMEGRERLEIDAERPVRHAMEVRHPSFDDERFFASLDRHGIASVLADTAGKFPRLDRDTGDFSYARLHGDTELYTSGYEPEALDRWAAKIDGWLGSGRDAYIYFDNDVKVRAPVDAMSLLERLAP